MSDKGTMSDVYSQAESVIFNELEDKDFWEDIEDQIRANYTGTDYDEEKIDRFIQYAITHIHNNISAAIMGINKSVINTIGERYDSVPRLQKL